jgi:hypothetical protein
MTVTNLRSLGLSIIGKEAAQTVLAQTFQEQSGKFELKQHIMTL